MSAAVAQADPSFVLAESQARAGDVMHFSIVGADDDVSYELEVADRGVLKGKGDGDDGPISGQFTMPDLGGSAKSVQVEAEIHEDGDKTTVKRKLQYLGQAIAAPAPPAPSQPAAAPQAAPVQAPAATQEADKPVAVVEQHSKRKRRHARQRRAAARRRDSSSHSETQTESKSQSRSEKRRRRVARHEAAKAKRARHPGPRTAPLFDGVPEKGSPRFAGGDDGGSVAPRESTKRPHSAVVTAALTGNRGKEPATAILVPGLLAVGAFMLAGAVLLRKRRTR